MTLTTGTASAIITPPAGHDAQNQADLRWLDISCYLVLT